MLPNANAQFNGQTGSIALLIAVRIKDVRGLLFKHMYNNASVFAVANMLRHAVHIWCGGNYVPCALVTNAQQLSHSHLGHLQGCAGWRCIPAHLGTLQQGQTIVKA